MEHLDKRSWQALWRGDPEIMGYFARHLAEPCEACEGFLVGHPAPGAIEGAVDSLLLPGEASDLGMGEPARRRHRSARGRAPRPRARRSALLAGLVGAAAALLVVLTPRSHELTSDGLKGAAGRERPGSVVQLRVSVGSGGEILPEGGRVAPGDVLSFRYRSTFAGWVTLYRETLEGREALGSFEVRPGEHPLRSAGGQVGYALDDERGPVRFHLSTREGEPLGSGMSLQVEGSDTR